MAGCKGITKKGGPCGFPPEQGQRLCRNHRNPEQAREAAERAWVASKEARERRTSAMIDVAYSLHNRASIQAGIDGTMRLHLGGLLSDSKARVQLMGYRLAMSNFDRPNETIEGYAPQSHDNAAHHMRTWGYLESVQPVLEEAAQREAAELAEMADRLEELE